MHHRLSSSLMVGRVMYAMIALEARSDDAAGKTCTLLTRDLVMRVETAEGRKVLERARPIEDDLGEGLASCKYGRVTLVLDPLRQPDQVRKAMRTGASPWQEYRPAAGVGDAAFFGADSSFANLYVWTGARHFHIQISVGFGSDETEALQPNAVELAKVIVPAL
jgi:hypothetical protein